MELKIIDQDFSVCKIKEFSPELLKDGFCFVGRTDEELCSKTGTGRCAGT